MRLLCHTVVRNEAGRYWQSWLDWHTLIFGAENLHVYDDNSDDATRRMALDAGVLVSIRGSSEPSFLEHEGQCRQRAWNVFEQAAEPEPGDWVFCIDADEFLMSRSDESDVVYREVSTTPVGALMVDIPEVFDALEDGGDLTYPQVRVDGWWGRISGTRLFRWQPGGVFTDKPMGCGSEPTYVVTAERGRLNGVWLLHYGYARQVDRQAKYQRYSTRAHGHSDPHIASIITDPVLVAWDGPWIPIHSGI